jgi:hypothetical protein
MDFALRGLLIGIVVGIVLSAVEYALLMRGAKERAARRKVVAELTPQERKQLSGVTRFSMLLPFVFAIAAWIIWS